MQKTNKKEQTKSISQLRVQPVGDRVLLKIESLEGEKKNSFGIIIPDTVNKERPEQAEVVAVGEGKFADDGSLIPMRVKVGDTVIFSKYGYDEIKVDGEEFLMVTESSILAIINK